MKKSISFILISVCMICFLSCSDSEVVSGTFHGKMYTTDTLDVDVKVTRINDGIIRLDVTGSTINGGYVEYAQLQKNAENAYNLEWYSSSPSGGIELNGYYYDGYLVFDSWNHQYKFSGGKE